MRHHFQKLIEYIGHNKRVQAGRITRVDLPVIEVEQADGSRMSITLPMAVYNRREPTPGDWYTIDADGDVSFSSARVFADDYARV